MPSRNVPPSRPPDPPTPAKQVASLRGHPEGVLALAFSPDRGLLASGGRDGAARLWDISASPPGERAALREKADRFRTLAFAPTGHMIAAGSGALDGQIWLFDISKRPPQEAGVLRGARGAVDALAFSPDGKLVAAAGEDRTLRIWEHGPGTRGEARTVLVGHARPVRSLAFSPDGQTVATASRDATVRLWTINKIRAGERAALPHPGEVSAVAWAPNGKLMATSSADGTIRLWDATTPTPAVVAELRGHTAEVRLLMFSTDSAALVSVSDGPRLINWDAVAGRLVREWELPAGTFAGQAVTSDGRYFAMGRFDGTIGLYRVADKR